MTGIAPAGPADAEALARLHAECFAACWPAHGFRPILQSPGVFAFVMPKVPPFEALIVARAVADEAEILTLATVPAARRRGFARSLVLQAAVEAAQRGAAQLFLEVASSNKAAIALYGALGFARAGARPRYYAEAGGETDALVLRAALPLNARNMAPPRAVD